MKKFKEDGNQPPEVAHAMLCDSILEAIGHTPLVRLHRVGAGLSCRLYAKCEFLNPGGSIKDRIGWSMVRDAEQRGILRPGDTLIEPTSGNTGIGIALAGAVRGYRVMIVMPEKMSEEKETVLTALGAEIIRTPTDVAFDDPRSHLQVARRLQQQMDRAHILDQYANRCNPETHLETTAQEILRDLEGKVDGVVVGVGTGGSITGIARALKHQRPDCIVVGADPVGSILAGSGPLASYHVEGIGYDFVPDVLERELVDTWVKTTDAESFAAARRLIAEEGLLCGGSSGAVLSAALRAVSHFGPGKNVVLILADGVRNYLSKFLQRQWRDAHGFSDPVVAR